ncbi:hypothetical protein M413DRAFT_6654 [Hebeloma cylindrosporum]|uniref:Uncharacterized protein n=1 Tax=Hebeloma cylindrosporum TaxID=76867 RepID=A0A0C2Z9D0_HEBCY|nr:hypothetical protein M413DRAFT_6654 [Hebeloma cylindrosporum h7]
MSMQDSAYNGSLRTQAQFEQYPSRELDRPGGTIALTPLCAACRGGHLETVKLLLANHANPNIASSYDRTPLYFITEADDDPQRPVPSTTRCAIIRELASGKGGVKAELDAPCDDEQNTPLMNAIMQGKDRHVIRQLIECGASITIEHPITQKTPKDLAEDHDLSDCLRTKAETDAAWGKLVDLVVSFVLLVVWYVNSKTMTNVVGGIVKKYYDISVEDAAVPRNLREQVEPKSIGEFKSFLDDVVKQDKKFEKFFSPNDPFLTNLATKANALRNDPTTDLGKPENIKHITRLSLYHPFIYCDDSSSMGEEDRYEYQTQLVTRIARIATKIVPDDMAGVELRFINNAFNSQVSAQEIEGAVRGAGPDGTTNIGTNLRKKILEPFVYDLINKPVIAGKAFAFRRPLLICIITDGSPYPEPANVLLQEIVECKRRLEDKGYDPTAVMFCISQVGTSVEATQFIEALRNEKEIEDVTYCTVGHLESQFKELKGNERALESWLLHVLTKPIMDRH